MTATAFTQSIEVIDAAFEPLETDAQVDRVVFEGVPDRALTESIEILDAALEPVAFNASSFQAAVFPPDAPTGLAFGSSGQLVWTAPTYTGAAPITDYVVQYRTASGPSEWVTFTDGVSSATTTTVTGLTPGTAYDFRVAASNAQFTGPWSATLSMTVASAPTGLNVSITDGVASVSWSAPASNGGQPITDYTLQYDTTAAFTSPTTWSHDPSAATSASVPGLVEGTVYFFRVAAVNSIGTSAWSGTVFAPDKYKDIILADGPRIYTRFNEASGTTAQDISGNGRNGTYVNTSRITYGTTGLLTGNTDTAITTTYASESDSGHVTFTKGTGASGWLPGDGLPFTIEMWVKPSSYPGWATAALVSRENLSGGARVFRLDTLSNGSLNLECFTNGSYNGGVATEAGTITFNQLHHIVITSNGNLSAPVTKIYVNGVEKASGSNYIGHSSSDFAMVVGRNTSSFLRPMPGVYDEFAVYDQVLTATQIANHYAVGKNQFAGAPTSLTATATSDGVSLSWTAPTSDGGLAITDYVVQYRTTAGPGTWTTFADGTSTGTTATITGLTQGTGYDFRVAAVNAAGLGAWSPTASATPFTVPGTPTGLTATPGVAEVGLSWTAPASDGGGTITDYVVRYRTSPSGEWATFSDGTSTATAATVTGLTNGVSYDFQVAAVNAAGTGDYSATETEAPFTVPGQVTDVTLVDIGVYDFTIEWTAPSDGGSPITDYTIEYRLIGAPTFDVYADGIDVEPTAIVGELEPATEYEFRIAAVNAAGTGPFSLPMSVLTKANIPAPLPGMGLKARIAQIAGVPGAELVDAANIWAGTSGESVVTALNLKAGTTGESVKTALNVLAGTTGEEAVVAARKIGGYP